MHTLVIDTSFGSTVGIVGHAPVVEHDSRTHVERLRNDIADACSQAGVAPHEVERIVVGVGPAPFTGLRAGIVTAKAIAYATGATLLGQDDLTPNAVLMHAVHRHDARFADRFDYAAVSVVDDDAPLVALTLSVNDARRKQLYFGLYADLDADDGDPTTLIDMDIDAPDHIAQRVRAAVDDYRVAHPGVDVVIDVIGHGACKYASAWADLGHVETVSDLAVLDMGAEGLRLFAQVAQSHAPADESAGAVEPLYLRRPDVSVPNPLKHVLSHDPAHKTDEGTAQA
ncbi:peptidase M22 [Bifidobacterium anseris]|uniref:Peptidase M22 n=1 Tax=Bifidobacterium anseris TaxID=2020963 RepID=A0A2N5J2D0_9BIFI|nr:tRNA (adenosine(37)-N6)-threonylcarbamoyltransferase complex dimerization subunit type 1 TsaB [Bifidobacterium anseris]PLS28358.1 peptidase M22 [Bifidobacterium anseris]